MSGAAVVIFTKNETRTIGGLIDRVSQLIGLGNIFVVDGHSTDGTISVIKEKNAQLYFDDKKGKGSAVRFAIKEIERDTLIFMDSDGSHRPEEIASFLEALKQNKDADMVVGSRFKGGSEEFCSSIGEFIRLIGNMLSTLLINTIWKAHLTDTQNGFRAVRRKAMLDLSLAEDSFAIEQEIIMECLKHKKKVIEIPSFELRRAFGKSRVIPFKMLPKYIFCFVRNIF
jgi:dolichol-phosphate mannosyltransferase